MKTRSSVWAIVVQLIMICGVFSAAAQQMPAQTAEVEVSDQELETFVDISNDLRVKQQEYQVKMVKVVDDSDLGREKFGQIAQSYQSGTDPEESFTEEELKAFQELNAELQPIQMEVQQMAMEFIQSQDMGVQRFQTIAQAIQTDQDLQQRFMALMQGNQTGE